MRTQKQIDASRANGHKSTGATTAQGKARIVAANLTSGIYAETEILPWEKAESFEQLKAEYYAHHRATSPEARFFIDELISCEWTLRRLRHASHALLEHESENIPRHAEARTYIRAEESLARLQTRINATRAAYHRALKDLQRLEAQEVHDAFAEETPDETIAAEEAPTAGAGDLRRLPRSCKSVSGEGDTALAPETHHEGVPILPEAS